MAIRRSKSTLARNNNEKGILLIGDDLKFDGNESEAKDYETTAAIDTGTNGTVTAINVTIPGGSAQSITINPAVDWSDAANDDALIEALEEAVESIGYECIGGSFELTRDSADLTIRVNDSALIWNYIDVTPAGDFTAIDRS